MAKVPSWWPVALHSFWPIEFYFSIYSCGFKSIQNLRSYSVRFLLVQNLDLGSVPLGGVLNPGFILILEMGAILG